MPLRERVRAALPPLSGGAMRREGTRIEVTLNDQQVRMLDRLATSVGKSRQGAIRSLLDAMVAAEGSLMAITDTESATSLAEVN